MCSKAESKDGCKATSGRNRNVVVDLVEFAMRVVHQEMAPFFEEHCHLWDYNEEDMKSLLSGSGESLQQHEVYRKCVPGRFFKFSFHQLRARYVDIITSHLDDFAAVSGFGSQKEVFAAVESAIEADKAQRKQLMSEIQSVFQQLKLKDEVSSKGDVNEDDEEDSKAMAKDDKDEYKSGDTKQPASILMFSQPIGLEFLLDSVLKLSEYETLRMMMMMKVKEKRMVAEIAKRAADRRDRTARRRRLLRDGGSARDLCDQFELLKRRFIELAPYNKHLHEAIEHGMQTRDLEDDLGRHPADPGLFKFARDHLTQITALASNNLSSQLEDDADALSNQASHADWLNLLHDTLDNMWDELDNRLTTARQLDFGDATSEPKA